MRTRDELVLERAQDLLEELPLGIKPFTLSTGDTEPSEDGAPDIWSVLSPFWALMSNEVAALNEKILLLNASLKGVVMEIKGEVVQDQLVPTYTSLAENMAPDSWKVNSWLLEKMWCVFIIPYSRLAHTPCADMSTGRPCAPNNKVCLLMS